MTDVPLNTADIVMFVDGSCKKNPDGTYITGYAVVTSDKVLKSSSLHSHFSAQEAELVALIETCKLGKNKDITVYTDSQYAFSTLNIFCPTVEK